jgi:hypothetical protein
MSGSIQHSNSPVKPNDSKLGESQPPVSVSRAIPSRECLGDLPESREEFVSMINKGHWTLLPAELIEGELLLRLSPLGVVPQSDQRPRTICDYTYFGVNPETLPLAPQEAVQFGKALQRVLQKIWEANPQFGPVHHSKIDIADGFYRVWVRPNDVAKLGVLFPSREGEPPLVALPNVLPMGWRESPPYFSTATETTADLLANSSLSKGVPQAPHRLDRISKTPPIQETIAAPRGCQPNLPRSLPLPPKRQRMQRTIRKLAAYWDVYVDDFIGLCQGGRNRRRTVKRHLLHSLDQVLRKLEPEDSQHRQEPASVKKLTKGDACWTTRKIILGWVVDTVAETVELPQHRVQRLQVILGSIRPHQRRVAAKQWHKVLGELRSMALAIPGARGLFSTLQEAFRHPTEGSRLKLNKGVHDFLEDFRWLARELSQCPTRLGELLPGHPIAIGTTDAAAPRMGASSSPLAHLGSNPFYGGNPSRPRSRPN